MSETLTPGVLDPAVGGVNNPLKLSGQIAAPSPAPAMPPMPTSVSGALQQSFGANVDLGRAQSAQRQTMLAGERDVLKEKATADDAAYEPVKQMVVPKFVPTQETATDLAGLFGMLGVLGTAMGGKGKAYGMDAMSAMTGMMTGYTQGRKDLYENELSKFNAANEQFKNELNMRMSAYNAVLKKNQTNADASLKGVALLATQFDDQVTLAAAKTGIYDKMVSVLQSQQQLGQQYANSIALSDRQFAHTVAAQAPHEVTFPDGRKGFVQAIANQDGSVSYRPVEGFGPAVKIPAIGLGAVQVRDNMTPEARVTFDKSVALAGPNGLDPATQKSIKDGYAAMTEGNNIAKEIASNPEVVGIYSSVIKTIGDRLNSIRATIFPSSEDKINALNNAVESELMKYGQKNPDKASIASAAIVMSKRLFGLALSDAQASGGRVTVYLERTLSGFYDPRLTPESLIGTIKVRADAEDSRLAGLYIGTDTQRDRDERFPLNAAPSVLDFMKRFGPQSDKPAAPGNQTPSITPKQREEAEEALEWANKNPNDPNADAVRKKANRTLGGG